MGVGRIVVGIPAVVISTSGVRGMWNVGRPPEEDREPAPSPVIRQDTRRVVIGSPTTSTSGFLPSAHMSFSTPCHALPGPGEFENSRLVQTPHAWQSANTICCSSPSSFLEFCLSIFYFDCGQEILGQSLELFWTLYVTTKFQLQRLDTNFVKFPKNMKQLGLDVNFILLLMKIYSKLFRAIQLCQKGNELLNG